MWTINKIREFFSYRDGFLILTKDVGGKHAGHVFTTIGKVQKKGRKPSFYVRASVEGLNTHSHRLIWMLHNGEIPAGYVVDHIDGDGTNNLITNLQCIPFGENIRLGTATNMSHNSTGHTGISYDTKFGSYRVELWSGNKRVFRQRCKTLEEAVVLRDKKRLELGIPSRRP